MQNRCYGKEGRFVALGGDGEKQNALQYRHISNTFFHNIGMQLAVTNALWFFLV